MPPDHGLGLDEHEDIEPARPESAQGDPEQAIRAADAWTSGGAGERRELLAQGEVLEREVGLRAPIGGRKAAREVGRGMAG
jgi:hypothetical protein